jgi:hypothetical protein
MRSRLTYVEWVLNAYVEWQGEERVKTGQQNEEGSDEIVYGRGTRIRGQS